MSAPAPYVARDLAARRANVPHTSMFVRMLVRAAVLRRGRAASALLAMVVAAAVATAMLNLYVDHPIQMPLRLQPAQASRPEAPALGTRIRNGASSGKACP